MLNINKQVELMVFMLFGKSFHFHSLFQIMSCGGYPLGFLISTKIKHCEGLFNDYSCQFEFCKIYFIKILIGSQSCSRINCVGGSGGSYLVFFFLINTSVVGFLISKILWVVGDIKIKISCLVGKLKPTQLNCVVLPQFKDNYCHFYATKNADNRQET